MKRKRHVFSSYQVFHEYFHNVQNIDNARESGDRCSWEINSEGNGIFYSYSSVIGIAIPKRKIILLRGGTISHTTSRHQAYLWRSVPPDWTRFDFHEWSYKSYYNGRWFSLNESLYKAYIEMHIDSLVLSKEKLYKCIRVIGTPEIETSILEKIETFCTAMKCRKLLRTYKSAIEKAKWTDEDKVYYDIKDWAINKGITGSFEEKKKLFYNPELLAQHEEKYRLKAERAAERKRILLQADFENHLIKQEELKKAWYEWEKSGSSLSLVDTIDEFIELQERRKKRLFWGYSTIVLLRYNAREQKVNTSLGIEIPLHEAERLYKFFKLCIKNGKSWYANGDKYKIAHQYDLQKVYKDEQNVWKLQAGCHTIREKEIDEFVTYYDLRWDQNNQ